MLHNNITSSHQLSSQISDRIMPFPLFKIDIGAVYTLPPKEHATVKPEAFKPVERELVFDIDLTDYDSIRTCCSGAKICLR